MEFLTWFNRRAGLLGGDTICDVSLWRWVPHPDKLSPGGPEIDALPVGDRTVVAVEAKWRSAEGKGQGVNKDKTQLRNEYFAEYGPRVFGEGRILVLATLAAASDGMVLPDPLAPWIRTVAVTRSRLRECHPHPRLDEYRRYYAWKVAHSRWSGRVARALAAN